ncbi:MAG: hypothetical protein GY759_22590 [Chloroflexi bacterium]|nr:hypothetical protein [Chloroflexota bacterium]
MFFPALVITYLLIVVQQLQRTRENVAWSLRPLLQIDDETFVSIVRRACRANPVGELLGFGVGVLIFLMVVGRFGSNQSFFLIGLYYYIISMIMLGAIGWSVYAVIVITRLTNTLLRQPIEVDIFDVTPLEPIGMQSLFLSLSFLGALVLVIPSSPYGFSSWQNIALFGPLLLVTVLVFFVNMNSTHRLLAATKKRQMTIVERRFAQTYYQLQELDSSGLDTHATATELNSWAAAKRELTLTRSWPYNTEMLRTLFISVMIPVLVGGARIIAPLLSG